MRGTDYSLPRNFIFTYLIFYFNVQKNFEQIHVNQCHHLKKSARLTRRTNAGLKEQALKNGISLTKLIEFSVRDYLEAVNTPKEIFQFKLLTKQCGAGMDAIVTDRNKLYDLMENED